MRFWPSVWDFWNPAGAVLPLRSIKQSVRLERCGFQSSGSADKYDNIESAVTQHMAVNLRGYLDINDARFFGSHLGNKGSGFNVKYASDPYWGLKIAALAYQVDKYVSGNDGSLTDYGTYSLGLSINTTPRLSVMPTPIHRHCIQRAMARPIRMTSP